MRVCSKPGCPTIYDGTESRCPTHRKTARALRVTNKVYDTKGHRVRFRLGVLRRDPICVLCGIAQSTDADHYPLSRIELVAQGLDADDPARGRGLCHPCHSKATANDPNQRGGWNNRT